MIELIRRVVELAIVLFIVVVIGNWMAPRVYAGENWPVFSVVGGALVLGYLVGDANDRKEFREAPKAVFVWTAHLLPRLLNYTRSYWRRG
jgi:hypothetical protein